MPPSHGTDDIGAGITPDIKHRYRPQIVEARYKAETMYGPLVAASSHQLTNLVSFAGVESIVNCLIHSLLRKVSRPSLEISVKQDDAFSFSFKHLISTCSVQAPAAPLFEKMSPRSVSFLFAFPRHSRLLTPRCLPTSSTCEKESRSYRKESIGLGRTC